MFNIDFSTYTFQGRRDYNQDYIAAEQINADTWVFVVADGMGGANGGELASYLAVNTLIDYLEQEINSISSETLKEKLETAVIKAHEAISERIEKEPVLSGMGTTLVCLLLYKNKYAWTSIGDSRIYKLDSEDVNLITMDHSYVQDYMNKNGKDLPKDIINNYSHILTRCIDGSMEKPDVYPKEADFEEINKGDSFMLCSDGMLTDRINTNVNLFKNFVLGIKDLNKAAKNLVAYAYEMGSDDNISVVLLRIGVDEIKELKFKEYHLPKGADSGEKQNLLKRIFKKNS